MILDHLRKSKKARLPQDLPKKPSWVSSENLSKQAYDKILQLKQDRLNYIKLHSKANDFKRKKDWQISGGLVAKQIGAATPTLTQTSSYSQGIRDLLHDINTELKEAKEKRVKQYLDSVSSSKKNQLKVTLLEENKSLSEQVLSLQKKNAEEQWHRLMNKLNPQVKDILGLASTVSALNTKRGR